MNTRRVIVSLVFTLICASAAWSQVTVVSGEASGRRAGFRPDGLYIDVGRVSPAHGDGAFSLGGGVGLGTLFTRHLDFSFGVRGWSSDIDRSDFGSATGGTFSDFVLQADFTLPLVKVMGLRSYLGTGLSGHVVGADIPADLSLEDALSGFNVGTQAVFGLASTRPGWGVRAQVRRDIVEDVGGTTFSIGAGWWPKSRARPASTRRVQVNAGASGMDLVTYAPGTSRTATTAFGAGGPDVVDLVKALNHLKQENRIIRAELDSLRRDVVAMKATPSTPVPAPTPHVPSDPPRDTVNDLGRALASLTMPAGLRMDGVSFVVQPKLQFPNGGTDLSLGAREELRRFASIILRYPDAEIEVQGHTDASGPIAVNQSLSERRALAVREELKSLGVSPIRLSAVGYGPTMPIAENSTPDGRARNRRVDIVITMRDDGR